MDKKKREAAGEKPTKAGFQSKTEKSNKPGGPQSGGALINSKGGKKSGFKPEQNSYKKKG